MCPELVWSNFKSGSKQFSNPYFLIDSRLTHTRTAFKPLIHVRITTESHARIPPPFRPRGFLRGLISLIFNLPANFPSPAPPHDLKRFGNLIWPDFSPRSRSPNPPILICSASSLWSAAIPPWMRDKFQCCSKTEYGSLLWLYEMHIYKLMYPSSHSYIYSSVSIVPLYLSFSFVCLYLTTYQSAFLHIFPSIDMYLFINIASFGLDRL